MNPYEILGVDATADDATIKKAYRKLAAQHHPDRGGDEQEFKKVNEAYSSIATAQKRQEYEHTGSAPGGFGDIFGNFGSIFEGFFGQKSRPQPKEQKDHEIFFNLKMSLDQIKQGRTQRVSYRRNKKCPSCGGVGGESKEECKSCNGTGVKILRTGRMIQQTTCRDCFGNGVKIKNICNACQGQGVIQVIESININITEL